MAIKYNDLYMDIRTRFREAGVYEPTAAARELVCAAAGKTKNELLRDSLLYASPEVERAAYDLAQRHMNGEPVAYLIGEWEFYGLSLDISPAVLIPRPDTEILVQQAIQALRNTEECRVLDLCAGSGCVGLAVASQLEKAHVLLGEIDDEAMKICRQNVRRNALTARVTTLKVDAMQKPPRQLGEFHCIVCNPPYISRREIELLDRSVKDYEPRLALDGGEDGLDFYRTISDLWRDALVPNGILAFEVGVGQADEVIRIMRSNGFGDLEVTKDTHMIPRVVCGKLCREI